MIKNLPEFIQKPLTTQILAGLTIPVFSDIGGQLQYGRESSTNWRVWFYIIYHRLSTGWFDLWRYLLVDGFLERQIAVWLKRYMKDGVALEVGTGEGRLLRYIPRKTRYIGFDIFIRENVARRANLRTNCQLFVASATDIPLPDQSVDYLISTEVLEHVAEPQKAVREMARVTKPGALAFITIPNNHGYKYQKKGPHPDHVNSWRYQEFIDTLAPYFQVIEGRMNGWWIPWLHRIKYSYQLPISHPDEFLNTNFLFVFKRKDN